MHDNQWKLRPDGSNWGDFGPNDQLGRLNLIDRRKVLQGIAEVREGRSFCLSLPLDYPGGNALAAGRYPPRLSPVGRNGKPLFNYEMRQEKAGATDVISDDLVLLHLQYSTHWDALSHVGQMFDADGDGRPEPLYYNGYRAGADIVCGHVGDSHHHDDVEEHEGALRLGVEQMAASCIQGRAVLIDIERHYGNSGAAIGYSELMSIMEKDNVTVESGDMVCIRTGFVDMVLAMDHKPDVTALFAKSSALDGRDERLLQWVTDSGVVAIIADNYAVEMRPAKPSVQDCCSTLPLHEHCLFKLGVYLGEMWYLTELAQWLHSHKRSRFLLTAPPLRLPRAVGSPVTPVATV
jgi:kynurenine formamidase